MTRNELRRLMRQRRRSLSVSQQRQAANQLKHALFRSGLLLQNRRRIAVYLVNDGEIDLQPLMKALQSCGREIYLPVLHPLRRGHLAFVRYDKRTRMTKNRFGIAEPVFYGTRTPARFISTICLPLVAFDPHGNRMGMGGGFYDRTLAFMRLPGHKPTLIGCAHQLQQVDQLPIESWDIPLSAIATDQQVMVF